MSTAASNPAMASGMKATFYGWHVVAAVFVLATFGWGLGFYGPPVYLHAVHESRGWSLNVVSTAVTVHFLFGAIVIANLPRLYRRFGLARVTKAGSLALAIGVTGWALAQEPWQLFVATLFSGGGWVTMGAAAVNAIVAPWFVRKRPAALASAYNGSSIGGVVFSPLWVAAIGLLGFPSAAIAIGVVVVTTVWILADLYYSKTPESMGLHPDGDAPQAAATTLAMSPSAKPLPNTRVWSDWRLATLAAGMALGLFAQIGLLAHLFSLLAKLVTIVWITLFISISYRFDAPHRTASGERMGSGHPFFKRSAIIADSVRASLAAISLSFCSTSKGSGGAEHRPGPKKPLLCPDHHCPVNAVAILRMCNANPLRAVQQQIGAMSS
jgi:MFS family permease